MAEKELEDYIKVQKSLGVSDDVIRRSLLSAGYAEEEFKHLFAKHAHSTKHELGVTTKHLVVMNLLIVIAFSAMFIYLSYDYNAKFAALSVKGDTQAANLSLQISAKEDSLKTNIDQLGRSLNSEITNTKNRIEAVDQDSKRSIADISYQALTRDSALSESVHQISNHSRTELSIFQEELKAVKDNAADFTVIMPKALNAVVTIGKKGEGFFTTAGSGVLINNVGYIVTNWHVIDGLSKISVKTHDGNEYSASVIGKDEGWDIAVIKVDADKSSFQFLDFADSDKVYVGEHIIAIGNPVGFESTVTEGIISNTNRLIIGDERDISYLQRDVAINAGNSGGPLIDREGNIVGIATLKYERAGFEGLSFALKSNDVQGVVLKLLENK